MQLDFLLDRDGLVAQPLELLTKVVDVMRA
jgi:hypothetical protein